MNGGLMKAGPRRVPASLGTATRQPKSCQRLPTVAVLGGDRRESMPWSRWKAIVLAVLVAGSVATAAFATTVSTPVDVTNDVYANNEESLGMDPTGTLLAGAWNDWEFNDGCGFSYSTDGGDHWAPE